jgi:hypothetical protein
MLDRDRKAGIIKRAPPHYIRKHAVCDHDGRSVLPPKILLRILLACLVRVSTMALRDNVHTGTTRTYLCRFANLLSDDFPLVGVVLFDGGKQRSALLTHQYTRTKVSQALITHFVFSEFCVVHVLDVSVRIRAVEQHKLRAYLVPMLLHASFSSLWERLWRDKSIDSTSTQRQHRISRRCHDRWLLCLPLRFRSSCFQYPSFASASAPQPASKAYLFCSSWSLVPEQLQPQRAVASPHCLLAPLRCCPLSLPSDLATGRGSQTCAFGL